MDMDFHYYGTYAAARIAGFALEEATTIAHAAQYVDNSIKHDGMILDKEKYGLPFQPIPTCHDPINELFLDPNKNKIFKHIKSTNEFTKFINNSIKYANESLQYADALILPHHVNEAMLRRTWVPFHFLPGNYKSTSLPDPNYELRKEDYTGPEIYENPAKLAMKLVIDLAVGDYWKYDKYAQEQFKLLCLPRSPLAAGMVNQYWKDKPAYWLHLIGIWMHAYADTGSHKYFAGTPAWHINDAGSIVYDRTSNSPIPIIWFPGKWYAIQEGVEAYPPDLSPPGLEKLRSIYYHGHVRMGHVPDYPWMIYSYHPRWSSKEKTKNNPELYIRTFKEMILALQYQEGNGRSIDYSRIDQDLDQLESDSKISKYIETVKGILGKKVSKHSSTYKKFIDNRCDIWRGALSSDGELSDLGKPIEYDPKAWVNTAKKSNKDQIQTTDYFKFNKAVIHHANFVKEELQKNGLEHMANW